MRLLLQPSGALGRQLAQLADEPVQKALVAEIRPLPHHAVGRLVRGHLDRVLAPADLLSRVHQVLCTGDCYGWRFSSFCVPLK